MSHVLEFHKATVERPTLRRWSGFDHGWSPQCARYVQGSLAQRSSASTSAHGST